MDGVLQTAWGGQGLVPCRNRFGQPPVTSDPRRREAMGRTLESMDTHSLSVPPQPLSKAAVTLNELLDEKIVLEETLAKFAETLDTHGVGILPKQLLGADGE
jgi:hypothetical protein